MSHAQSCWNTHNPNPTLSPSTSLLCSPVFSPLPLFSTCFVQSHSLNVQLFYSISFYFAPPPLLYHPLFLPLPCFDPTTRCMWLRRRTFCWTPTPTSRSQTSASATSSRWATSWTRSVARRPTQRRNFSRARSTTALKWTSGAWESSCTHWSAARCHSTGRTWRQVLLCVQLWRCKYKSVFFFRNHSHFNYLLFALSIFCLGKISELFAVLK